MTPAARWDPGDVTSRGRNRLGRFIDRLAQEEPLNPLQRRVRALTSDMLMSTADTLVMQLGQHLGRDSTQRDEVWEQLQAVMEEIQRRG